MLEVNNIENKIAEWKEDFARFCRAEKKADSTIDVYWCSVECFIRHFKTCSVDRIHWKEVADYILKYNSARTVAQKKGAIQLFYSVCIRQKNKLALMPNPKREHKIPQILNLVEVDKVIECPENIKHRAILKVAYDCGLRISEVRSLRIKHIDGKARTVFIENSKGAKDRVVPISEEALVVLREYFKKHFSSNYDKDSPLFIGEAKDHEEYSESSMRAILRDAVKKAGVNKKIKFHSLRHSRASHLKNSGIDIRDIADFLGHESTKSVEVYLHTGVGDLQSKIADADRRMAEKKKIQSKTL